MTLKSLNIAALSLFSILIAAPVQAITFTPFGAFGEGGEINGQTLTVGSGGSVFEVDAFVNIAGADLNGGVFGTSAQLAFDPLPTGFDYLFSPSLSADTTDLSLSYTFTNNTGSILAGVSFFSFFDAEIDEPLNTFFNEYAEISGAAGVSPTDPNSFEIDEPGFVFGDIFENLLLGSLDNSNAVPFGAPDDVSFALGFDLGSFGLLDAKTIDILISEDGDAIGSLALTQLDFDTSSTSITYSGQIQTPAPVPEPSTLWLLSTGLVGLGLMRRHRSKRSA